MLDRSPRRLAFSALCALAAVASATGAGAQTQKFYSPPKIVKMGSHASRVSGTGAVEVKVFVKKDGSVGSAQVLKSTNPHDNAAALEIAKSSSYKAGAIDAKPGDFFYTITLKFNGSSVTSDDLVAGGAASGGGLTEAKALIRENKFADAKAMLQTYLGTHPGDQDAETQLGVADAFSNDPVSAAAAFDAAGTIPPNYRIVAAQAYSNAAIAALKDKNNDQAIALADKAYALQQNVNTLYIRATAHTNAGQYTEAIGDFERAKTLAQAGKGDADTMNSIDTGLMTAYLLGGQGDKGLAIAQDLRRRDPSNPRIDDALAAYYTQQAALALKAGNNDAAVTALEAGAAAVPKQAGSLYAQAASVIAQAKPPDWKKVKAEADKSLAADPEDAQANFIAGVALANTGNKTGALPFLQKAKANAGSDTRLAAQVDAALKALGSK